MHSTSRGASRSDPPVQLEPFLHQVGGHYPMVCLDTETVCKPLNDREHCFYKSMTSSLCQYAPMFKGTMKVETTEDEEGYITLKGQPPPYLSCRRRPSDEQDRPHVYLKRKQSIEIEHDLGDVKALVASENMENGRSNGEEWFYNPWALKCHRDHLKKLGIHGPEHPNEQMYLLLENLVAKYRHPCVLDIKVGTRQYADDVSAAKKQRKIAKAANTTSATLGLRLCGMQVYNVKQSRYICYNKYHGRTLSPQGFQGTIKEFLTTETEVRYDVLYQLMDKLTELSRTLQSLESYRFYTSSLLITYDAIPPCDPRNEPPTTPTSVAPPLTVRCSNSSQPSQEPSATNSEPKRTDHNALVDVRIIDFAHSTHRGMQDSTKHIGPDEGFIFGLKNFISILSDLGNH